MAGGMPRNNIRRLIGGDKPKSIAPGEVGIALPAFAYLTSAGNSVNGIVTVRVR